MRQRKARKRVAISELMGSLIMIAITLVAGAAVFGFVNGQANASASQLGASQATNMNYLREKETIALVNFDNNTGLSIYINNYGAETLTINSISIQGPACLGTATNCAVATQVSATIVYSRLYNKWTLSPSASLTCAGEGAGGLLSISQSNLQRVWVNLKSCDFVFAATSATLSPLPPSPATPLIDYFKVAVQGYYGSTATTSVGR